MDELSPEAIRAKVQTRFEQMIGQGYSEDEIRAAMPQIQEQINQQIARVRSPGPWAPGREPGAGIREEVPAWLTPGASRSQADDFPAQPTYDEFTAANEAAKKRVQVAPNPLTRPTEFLAYSKELLSDPARRRQLERGLSDTVTLGLAEKATRGLEGMWGGKEFSQEQAAADAAAAGEKDRDTGRAIGSVLPGATTYIARNTAAPFTAAAGATGSRILAPVVGAAGGAVSVPLTAGITEGARSLAEGDISGAPRRAWDEAAAAATSPVAMALGAGMGAAGGLASGIRNSDSRTGEDIRMAQEAGGEPNPVTGASGGAYADPRISGMRGTTAEQAAVARHSAREVMGGLNRRFQEEYAQPYARERAALEARGANQQLLPTDDIAARAATAMGSESFPAGTKGYIQREVIDVLNRYRDANGGDYVMPAGRLNELRQKLDDAAKLGNSEVSRGDRAIRGLYSATKDAVDTGDFAELNRDYAAGKQRFHDASKQLGTMSGKVFDPATVNADRKAELALKRISDRLFRQGEGARLQGTESEDIAAFLRTHPEYTDQVMASARLAAKNRMQFRMPEGGLLPSVQGALGANVEPAEVALYRAGRALGRAQGPVNALVDARRRQKERDAARAQRLKERMGAE